MAYETPHGRCYNYHTKMYNKNNTRTSSTRHSSGDDVEHDLGIALARLLYDVHLLLELITLYIEKMLHLKTNIEYLSHIVDTIVKIINCV